MRLYEFHLTQINSMVRGTYLGVANCQENYLKKSKGPQVFSENRKWPLPPPCGLPYSFLRPCIELFPNWPSATLFCFPCSRVASGARGPISNPPGPFWPRDRFGSNCRSRNHISPNSAKTRPLTVSQPVHATPPLPNIVNYIQS